MAVIRISDQATQVAELLVHIRAGDRVVIEEHAQPIALVQPSALLPKGLGLEQPKLVSELLAELRRSPMPRTEPNYEFAGAVEEGISIREHERLTDPWDAF